MRGGGEQITDESTGEGSLFLVSSWPWSDKGSDNMIFAS